MEVACLFAENGFTMNLHVPIRFLGAIAFVVLLSLVGLSQSPPAVDPAIAKEIEELERRLKELQEKLKKLKEQAAKPLAPQAPPHLDKLFAWRSIGPANMGGRVTGLAVFEADPTCYYVATASGG